MYVRGMHLYNYMGRRGELGQGKTATPLITSVVFSQLASRKHFSAALVKKICFPLYLGKMVNDIT